MEEWSFIALVVVALAVGVWLAVRGINANRTTTTRVSLGKLFEISVSVEQGAVEAASDRVKEAARQKNLKEYGPPLVVVPNVTRLTRVLWVDDNPDNNLNETVAASALGLLVTATTSTSAALRYMTLMDFKVVITDLGRGEDSRAGAVLIEEIGRRHKDVPVIVYTRDAGAVRNDLLASGARGVFDSPGELINELQRIASTPVHRGASAE